MAAPRHNIIPAEFARPGAGALAQALLAATLSLAAFSCPAAPKAWLVQGEVTRVNDGDTLTVLDTEHEQHKIRLAAIDAPERRQPHGDAARQALGAAVLHQQVQATCRKRDRYRREVCSLHLGGADISLDLLRAGLAWHYLAYVREQPREQALSYAAAQDEARLAARGLWADRDAVPPWLWRRGERAGPAASEPLPTDDAAPDDGAD
jgi:endonuclease YncB( thermonuclease family)